MKKALVYLGKYSPVLMGALDACYKNKQEYVIFIEVSSFKSIVDDRFLYKHISSKDPVVLKNSIVSLFETFDKIYCMSLFYHDTLFLYGIQDSYPNLIVMGPPRACINILQNKEQMNFFARDACLPLLVDLDINSLDISKNFPLVLRPKSEISSEFKVEFINTIADLKPYLSQGVVAQPYIEGPNLVVHVVKSSNTFECKFFLVKDKFEGMSLTLSNVIQRDYEELEPKIYDFLTKTEFTGVGHFEFIIDEKSKKLYFLEFNGRFGGTSLKAASLGHNDFYHLLYLYKYIDTPYNEEKKTNLVVNYFSLLKCILNTIKGDGHILDYPSSNNFSYVSNLFTLFIKAKNDLSFLHLAIKKDYIFNLIRKRFKNEKKIS